jgi:hypothetical protein
MTGSFRICGSETRRTDGAAPSTMLRMVPLPRRFAARED